MIHIFSLLFLKIATPLKLWFICSFLRSMLLVNFLFFGNVFFLFLSENLIKKKTLKSNSFVSMCLGLIILGQISVVPGESFQCIYSVLLFLESFWGLHWKHYFVTVYWFFFSLGHLIYVCWNFLPIFHFIYFLWPIFSLSHLILFFTAFLQCSILFLFEFVFWEGLL